MLRNMTVRVAWAVAFIAMAAVFLAGGLALCLWSLYQYIAVNVDSAAAAGILTGLAALLVALVLAAVAKAISR